MRQWRRVVLAGHDRRGERAAVFGEARDQRRSRSRTANDFAIKDREGRSHRPRRGRQERRPLLRHDGHRLHRDRNRQAWPRVGSGEGHREQRSRWQPARRHAGQQGHVELRSRPVAAAGPKGISSIIPGGSLLAKWRDAAADPKRQEEAAKLAEQVQALLSGTRPSQEKSPDRVLFDDALVSMEQHIGALFQGIDVAKVAKPQAAKGLLGWRRRSFTRRTATCS